MAATDLQVRDTLGVPVPESVNGNRERGWWEIRRSDVAQNPLSLLCVDEEEADLQSISTCS
jgi:hypothetical protein